MLSDAQPSAPPSDLIKAGTDATFMADVIEASKVQPVIVDFWATWCGPCRQLTPALEKAVTAARGAVKLVKIDVDKNPAFAGQLRVQSIPTVFAFVDGQPVDAFMGAVPESQLKAFIDKLTAGAGPSDLDQVLEEAKLALAEGDLGGAAQLFAHALELEPGNAKAVAGLARCYLTGGDVERAKETLAMAAPDAKDSELDSVKAAVALADQGASGDAGELGALEQRVAADPNDHQARFDLAKALAGHGQMQAAADHLLAIIAKDRDWNEAAAKKQLLTIFEAAGPTSEVAKTGRRRLSSILFS